MALGTNKGSSVALDRRIKKRLALHNTLMKRYMTKEGLSKDEASKKAFKDVLRADLK